MPSKFNYYIVINTFKCGNSAGPAIRPFQICSQFLSVFEYVKQFSECFRYVFQKPIFFFSVIIIKFNIAFVLSSQYVTFIMSAGYTVL